MLSACPPCLCFPTTSYLDFTDIQEMVYAEKKEEIHRANRIPTTHPVENLCFKDSSQWWGDPNTANNSSDYKESQWINCWNNPSWGQEEVSKWGLKSGDRSTEEEEEDKIGGEDEDDGESLVEAGTMEENDVLLTVNTGNLQTGCESTSPAHALVALLKACTQQNELQRGSKVHADVIGMGMLERNAHVASAVVSMYAKCGMLARAQQVFDTLPLRDVVSWNALIAGYVLHGNGEHALTCLKQMETEGLVPNSVTFACILKACGSIGAADKGQEIHTEIVRRGLLENHVSVANALVDMYGRCGLLIRAQEVFDKLPAQDGLLWNVLITGYVQHGLGVEALKRFGRMQLEGFKPDAVTFVSILKACGSIGATNKGQDIHAKLVREGLLEKHLVVGNALVDMYVKCDLLAKAQEVFDKLPLWDVVSWNALIAGYVQNGLAKEALELHERMQLEGLSSDAVTFVCILKACGTLGAADKGQEIHDLITKEGLLEKYVVVGTALVDMYAKLGLLAKAQEVFSMLPVHDVVSWNVLTAGYAQHGHGEQALECFEWMQREGLYPDVVTYVSVLQACGSLAVADRGQDMHVDIVREGLLEKSLIIGNALVGMYAKCGLLVKAQEVFDKLPYQDVVSWSVLITGYAHHGHGEVAIKCFELMQLEGLTPNKVTFISILKACGNVGAADKGKEIHAMLPQGCLKEKDNSIGIALVDMYAKCGLLAKAQEVFDELSFQDLVSWSVLIAGYTQRGLGKEALNCFEQMQLQGLSPDAATFIYILKACSIVGVAGKGQEIHAEVVRKGLLDTDTFVANAIVDMYAKCGQLAKAQEVFDSLSVRDLVSWNVLITGYVHHGHGEKALNCFEQMRCEGPSPDLVTFVCILKACGNVGAANKGREVHADMVREGLLESNSFAGNAVMDMYAKCGLLTKAQEVFDHLPFRDVVSWNVLIAGYALLGNIEIALMLLDKMLVEGMKPDFVTFTSILNVCSHTGLLFTGQLYFEDLSTGFGINPTIEHHSCMVDLFGRAGLIDKAVATIKEMPVLANFMVWLGLLGACQKWGNMKLARLAFEHAAQFEQKDSAAYVCMSNIYSGASSQ